MSETIVLNCPDCETRFVAPLEKFIPNGRQVRCSNCRHTWFQAAPAAREGSLAGAEVVSTAPKRHESSTIRKEVAEQQRRSGGGFWNWLLWLLVLALLGLVLAYVFKDKLVSTFPQLAPTLERYTGQVDRTAQRLVGDNSASTKPLRVTNFRYDIKEYDGETAMLVEADLLNTSDAVMDAPMLAIQVIDAEEEALFGTSVGPEDINATSIEPGQSVRYFTRIPEPPKEFDRVVVGVSK